jgi:hypothetical protein
MKEKESKIISSIGPKKILQVVACQDNEKSDQFYKAGYTTSLSSVQKSAPNVETEAAEKIIICQRQKSK